MSFQIKLHSKDIALLSNIQAYFGGVGKIYNINKDVIYMVRSLKDIFKIIAHLDKYPLITKKKVDYVLFKSIVEKLLKKEHIISNSIQEIVNIRASINLGLSKELKKIFPNTIPVIRPFMQNTFIIDPE